METGINQTMDTYNNIIKANPILSANKEAMILKTIEICRGGKIGQIAREKLFNSNVRLVLKEAYSFISHTSVPVEDLISAGCEGLLIAIDRFNLKFNVRFSTYATPWIRLKIFRIMKELGLFVHVPSNVSDKSKQYHKIINSIEGQDDANLTDKELMETLELTAKGLRNVRMAKTKILSFDHKYTNAKSGSDNATLADIIPDTHSQPVDEAMMDSETRGVILRYINNLKPIQKEILINRYLKTDKKEILVKLGKKYRMTGERIRQIEYSALRILRKRMRSRALAGLRD